MRVESKLSLGVPNLPLVVGEVRPGDSNDLRQRTMIGLDLGGDVLVLDERRAEENERVWRTRDVILWLLPRVPSATRGSGRFDGREEHGLGRRTLMGRWIEVRLRCHSGCKRDGPHTGGTRRGRPRKDCSKVGAS